VSCGLASAPPQKPLKRGILDRKCFPDFQGLRPIRFQKKLEGFACGAFGAARNWQNEERQLIPICIGIPIVTEYGKSSAYFLRFLESVGPHKRSQTLSVITSHSKYICNIKIKIKIFSIGFSSDFELDLHPKSDAFYSKTPSSLLACRRMYVFYCKTVTFSGVNQAQNRMKTKSKIFLFLFYVGNV